MIDPMLRVELEEEQPKQEFAIENIKQATWAFRKLKALDEADEEINQAANYDIQKTKEWQESELAKNQGSREYFNHILSDYYSQRSAEDPDFELKTPYGWVKSYKGRKKWHYDDAKLVQSLKENDGQYFLKIKETVDKKKLKSEMTVVGDKVVNSDGVILDGVSVQQEPDHVDVKLSESR